MCSVARAVSRPGHRSGFSNFAVRGPSVSPGPGKSKRSDSLDYSRSNESPGTISQKYLVRLRYVMIRTTLGAPELPLSVLRAAYVDGWFPMGELGTRLIEWFSPDPRGVLPLTAFHVPVRLGRTLRAGRFDIRVDTAFAAVMDWCVD